MDFVADAPEHHAWIAATTEPSFATNGDRLYSFIMGWPEKLATINPLATSSRLSPPKVRSVELLGYKGTLVWVEDEQGLTVVI